MALAALLMYLAALVLAFGWRTYQQLRSTGDSGLRLESGPAGSPSWWGKFAFLAALLLFLAGLIAGLAGLPSPQQPVVHIVGAVLAALGIVAVLAAQTAMGASWRVGVDAGERTELVTGGPFALARNPIFTAMIATTLGLTLMVPNAIVILAFFVLVAAVELQVRAVEEPYLEQVHGAAYRQYAARVGRFVPGVGRLPLT